MSAINLANVMEALADQLVSEGVVTRAYGWPVQQVNPPCAAVNYPESIDFDVTFGRGSDKAVFTVDIFCGAVHDRSARDVVSGYITGAQGVKDALDGTLGGAVQVARVKDCKVLIIPVGGVDYLSARFDVEVWT